MLTIFISPELGANVLAEIGEKEGDRVVVKNGRFGMFINWKKVNAKMPPEYMDNPSELPLEEAWSLIEAKMESMGSKVDSKTKKAKNESPAVDLPPGPKRPLSAYLHFSGEKRPEVSQTASSLGDASKELARMWAETSEEDRKPYLELAQASKEEYEIKKAEWTKECQALLESSSSKASTATRRSSTPSSSKKASVSIAKETIKRPRSSYVFFCSDKRPEVAKTFNRLGDVSKELARLWSEVTPEERKIYENMALEDKKRHEQEKLAIGKAINGHADAKTEKKVSVATTSKKRGPSAYMLFCAAHRNSIVDENGDKLPLGESTKQLAKMWKECDEETRSEFQKQAEKQKEAVA